MFMSLYVIYGFDTASTLAEETRNPRREAPKAVLASWSRRVRHRRGLPLGRPHGGTGHGRGGRGFFGPDRRSSGRWRRRRSRCSTSSSSSASIFVCCMAMLTSTIRLAFGMAGMISSPSRRRWRRSVPRLHTPVGTCVIVGALGRDPVHPVRGRGVIAVGATASIYFSYLLGNLAFMRARAKGWPKTKAPFSLGVWGKVVNVVAILWGAAMLLNFLTPSSATPRSTRTRPAPTTSGSSRTRSPSRRTTSRRASSSSTSRSGS